MKNLINEYNDIIDHLVSVYSGELYSFHKNSKDFVNLLERNKIKDTIRFDWTHVDWHLLIPIENLKKVLSGKNISANFSDLKLDENAQIYLVQNILKQIVAWAKKYEISLPHMVQKKIEKMSGRDVRKYYVFNNQM